MSSKQSIMISLNELSKQNIQPRFSFFKDRKFSYVFCDKCLAKNQNKARKVSGGYCKTFHCCHVCALLTGVYDMNEDAKNQEPTETNDEVNPPQPTGVEGNSPDKDTPSGSNIANPALWTDDEVTRASTPIPASPEAEVDSFDQSFGIMDGEGNPPPAKKVRSIDCFMEIENFHKTVVVRKNQTSVKCSKVNFTKLGTGYIPIDKVGLQGVFDEFIKKVLRDQGHDPNTVAFSFHVHHPGMEKGCFAMVQKTMADINGGVILERLGVLMQSRKNVKIDSEFYIEILILPKFTGPNALDEAEAAILKH